MGLAHRCRLPTHREVMRQYLSSLPSGKRTCFSHAVRAEFNRPSSVCSAAYGVRSPRVLDSSSDMTRARRCALPSSAVLPRERGNSPQPHDRAATVRARRRASCSAGPRTDFSAKLSGHDAARLGDSHDIPNAEAPDGALDATEVGLVEVGFLRERFLGQVSRSALMTDMEPSARRVESCLRVSHQPSPAAAEDGRYVLKWNIRFCILRADLRRFDPCPPMVELRLKEMLGSHPPPPGIDFQAPTAQTSPRTSL